MSATRCIAVVTGSRADYGLLRSLLFAIHNDETLTLQLIVTGMHLAPEFGLTYRQIEADGLPIAARVEMLVSSDTATGVAKSMGLGLIGFADTYQALAPDLLVVLGDRFEILAAAQAALVQRIPMAHIHGGETSEGAFDESIRHALTKMAQWHFVAAEPYRQRVIQMGEAPERVFNFGAPGLDQLDAIALLDRGELSRSLGIAAGAQLLLVTYHPATLGERCPVRAMDELCAALARFEDAVVVFTYPNADTGGRALIDCVDRFVALAPARRHAFASLGQHRYLSLMRAADVVVGNSSSGLIEAPALHRATVNLGDRQKGRLRAASVIDTEESRDAIERAVRLALSADFQRRLPEVDSPYGKGQVGVRIRDTLSRVPLAIQKPFFDIAHTY
jgi:UDP-N-acetylglucosamine 2-epimerase (non-hydrolysing)/GDP/UDP-N,N'-diacetylbacillosamine 2-epimerase (hydrolysing)